MVKKFVRRYPGYALILIGVQAFFIAALLVIFFLKLQTLRELRVANETQYAAIFISDVQEIRRTLEDADLTREQKKLMIYQKACEATEALTETGYPESVKRDVTEALNRIARRMLKEQDAESPLIEETELAIIQTHNNSDSKNTIASNADKQIDDGAKPARRKTDPKEYRKSCELANRIFGVKGTLTMEALSAEGACLFSCKNAYAVINTAELYPLEAASAVPCAQIRYSTNECRAFAERFIEDFYPKKIRRSMVITEENDFDDRVEELFSGKGNKNIRIVVSKASGKMISLKTFGMEEND